jgi:carbon dioxide concentrating mechanism protein CcmN
MRLPPLQPISNAHFYVSGNVTIHPSVAIAPGVLLQADAESQIIIAAGVCVGMGTVLHAHQGNLEIEEGVVLGAGVLLLGSGRIGANACIGSKVTVFNSSIEPNQVVQSGSLIGDVSRTIIQTETVESGETAPQPAESDAAQASSALANTASAPVYGKAAVNRLIIALFPGGHPSNNLSPSNQSHNGETPE